MKKKVVIIVFVVSIIGFLIIINKFPNKNEIIGIYLDNELQDNIPKKGSAVFSKAVCGDDNVSVSWDSDNWGVQMSNLSKKVKCNLYFVNYSGDTVFNFDYTGGEQVFTIPVSGTYKLETWGAQGGSSVVDGVNQNDNGGNGGYSNGIVKLKKSSVIYINVGGRGADGEINVNDSIGGYNGGGIGHWDKSDDEASGGGGGATHMALKSGLLSNLESYKSEILIVTGGGGGAAWTYTSGAGGGYIGTNSYNNSNNLYSIGGNQDFGYKFGIGGSGSDCAGTPGGGGGGGYYGGFGGYIADYKDWSNDAIPGGGGSGYIGNTLLKDKIMYCYNCEESNEESTKTISTTCSEETPISYCTKKGNGYARITLVSIDE